MAYVVALLLAIWVWLLRRRVTELAHKIETLEVRVRALAAEREPLLLETVAIGPEPKALPPKRRDWRPWLSAAVLALMIGGYMHQLAAGAPIVAAGILAAVSAIAALLGRGGAVAAATVLLCVCGALQIWLWPLAALGAGANPAIPFVSGLIQIGFASLAAQRRWARGSALAAHAAATVLGVAGYFQAAPAGLDAYAAALALAGALAASAFIARTRRRERGATVFAGAFSAAALCAIAAFSQWQSGFGALALALGAVMLLGLGALVRDAGRGHWPQTFWYGAGAALVLLLAHALTPAALQGAAIASLTAAFALLARASLAFRAAAAASALAALAHVAAAGALPWPEPLRPALTALLLFAAVRFARAYPVTRDLIDAAAWGAIILAALGGLAASPLSIFTRTALEALALLSAGLLASVGDADRTPPRRWLGQALIALGFVTALGGCGFTYNPWWGQAPATISGPPIFNPLALAFGATGALAATAAARWSASAPRFARWCLTAGLLFALLWLMLELRRLVHGPDMATAPTSGAEMLGYVALIVLALAVSRSASLRRLVLEPAARAAPVRQ